MEKDAKGNQHNFTYNVMGRLTQRTGPEGTTGYGYYAAGNGYANQPHTITGFNGVNEEYNYDRFGRCIYSKTLIDGETFETIKYYNDYGDLIQVTDNNRLGYTNSYDANGFLQNVQTNWYGAPYYASETVFTSGSINGQGQYTSYMLGNGNGKFLSQFSRYFNLYWWYDGCKHELWYGSYNFSDGSLRSLWDWSDLSTMERIGYTAGALANMQDLVAWNVGGINTTRAEHGDGILHARSTGDNYNISVAHVNDGDYKYSLVPGDRGYSGLLENLDYARYWGTHLDDGIYYGHSATGWKATLYNVNSKIMENMYKNISRGKSLWGWNNLKYGTTFSGCYGQVARALFSVGVPTIPFYGFTPHGLVMQLWLRQAAIYASPILINR